MIAEKFLVEGLEGLAFASLNQAVVWAENVVNKITNPEKKAKVLTGVVEAVR